MRDSFTMLSPSTVPYSNQPGFARTFADGRLTLGLFFPIASFAGDTPSMEGQAELAKVAEAAGFAALWLRDVPLYDPGFGDLGQVFDPFVYLGYIAGQTSAIAIATGSIVVPIRNPLHLAKAAASVDQLSQGRLLLGVASGDRPVEFPAFGVDSEQRGEIFREYINVMRQSQRTRFTALHWSGGSLAGADMVPKPFTEEVPLLVTGRSRQSMDWIAKNAHGWITYPRPPKLQKVVIEEWRAAVIAQCGQVFKPFVQSLYLDLAEDPCEPPRQIHLGYRLGRSHLIALLDDFQSLGVNHVMLNLRFCQRSVVAVLNELERHVLPRFPTIIRNSHVEWKFQ